MPKGPFILCEQSSWNSTCAGCGEVIPKESTRITVSWVRYKCFYHLECWRVLSRIVDIVKEKTYVCK